MNKQFILMEVNTVNKTIKPGDTVQCVSVAKRWGYENWIKVAGIKRGENHKVSEVDFPGIMLEGCAYWLPIENFKKIESGTTLIKQK